MLSPLLDSTMHETFKKKVEMPDRLWSLCCSVAQSCPTLCDPMDRSTPGLSVPHHLPKFAQVHVHCTHDAIQPSHPLVPSFPFIVGYRSTRMHDKPLHFLGRTKPIVLEHLGYLSKANSDCWLCARHILPDFIESYIIHLFKHWARRIVGVLRGRRHGLWP